MDGVWALIVLGLTLCKDSSPCDSCPCFHHRLQQHCGCPGMLLHCKLLQLISSLCGFISMPFHVDFTATIKCPLCHLCFYHMKAFIGKERLLTAECLPGLSLDHSCTHFDFVLFFLQKYVAFWKLICLYSAQRISKKNDRGAGRCLLSGMIVSHFFENVSGRILRTNSSQKEW